MARPVTRILFVAIHYWPEITGNAPYTTMLAEHLAERGHDVNVLTGMPHYPEGRIRQAYRGRLSGSEEQRGVRIRRRAHYVPEPAVGIQAGRVRGEFPAHRLVLDGKAAPGRHRRRLAVHEQRRPGRGVRGPCPPAIRTHPPGPDGPGGRTIGNIRRRGVARATAAAEGWLARRAAAVAVVSPDFVPYLLERGVVPDRITHVPNWTHIAELTATGSRPADASAGPIDETVVLHAGNIGLKQGLDQVVAAARPRPRPGRRHVSC